MFFFLPIWEKVWQTSDKVQCTGRFWAHFRATDFAAPMVVTVWSSVDEFQALAMRLAARVLLPGTYCVAFVELMDLVCLMMDLSGKSFLLRGSLAFFDFHTMRAVWEATISFKVRRPAFSRTDFEDTLSLREVFVIVRATDLIDRLMFSVARFAARSSWANLKGIAAGAINLQGGFSFGS